VTSLALRSLVRYLVPLALATAIVCAPLLLVAFRAPPPRDLATANAALRTGFAIAGVAWMAQLALVAAAAPLVRAVATSAPLSQLRAVVAAVSNLVRMIVPCAAAIACVVVGCLALVIPGLVLLVLVATTGASTERGMPAPLVTGADVVRAHWRTFAAIVAAMLVVDVAIAVVAWKLIVPATPAKTPQAWAAYGAIARTVALGVLATAPVFSMLLAAARVRYDQPT
jgi:hypothetical protein